MNQEVEQHTDERNKCPLFILSNQSFFVFVLVEPAFIPKAYPLSVKAECGQSKTRSLASASVCRPDILLTGRCMAPTIAKSGICSDWLTLGSRFLNILNVILGHMLSTSDLIFHT